MAETLDLREIGASGLKRAGGYIQEEWLPQLSGRKALQVYREMKDNDATIGAILYAADMLIRQVDWSVEPAGGSREDLAHAEFLKSAMADMSHTWPEFLSEVMSMLPFGFCLPGDELIYDERGACIPIADIQPGMKVLSGAGHPRKVLAKFVRKFTGELVRLRVLGLPREIRLTPEHQVLTQRGWVPAGELVKGDKLLRPRLPMRAGGSYLDGWFVGLYLAEGSGLQQDDRLRVAFSLHVREVDEVADRLEQLIRDKGWQPHHHLATCRPQVLRGVPSPNSGRVAFTHPEFFKMLSEWIEGHDAATKRLRKLPEHADFARGIWDGWVYGDAGTTVSRDLAAQMQLIAGSLGLPSPLAYQPLGQEVHVLPDGRTLQHKAPGVYWVKTGATLPVRMSRPTRVKRTRELEAEAKRLREEGFSYPQIGKKLGISALTAWNWINKAGCYVDDRIPYRNGRHCKVCDSVVWHPILEVEREPYNGEVYDITVDIDHTFLPSGITVSNSAFETVYKRREGDVRDPTRRSLYNDGKIGWRKFAVRAQESIAEWDFGDDGGLRGFWQQPPPDYGLRYIPIEKALLFRTSSERNNPEGRSILRPAYRSWYFLKRIQEIESIGLERDLAGLPIIEVPPELLSPSATPEQKAMVNALLQVVTQVRRDQKEGVVMPAEEVGNQRTGYRFRLLSTGGRRQFDTNAIIRRYELNIAMSALTQFLFLGTQGIGSFALASSQTNLFAMALGAYMDSVAAVLNRFAVPQLFTLNGVPTSRLPKIVHGDMEAPSAEEVARIIQSMAQAGAMLFPNRELETAILRLLKLPGPPPDDEEQAITRARQHITQEMRKWGLLRRANHQATPA